MTHNRLPQTETQPIVIPMQAKIPGWRFWLPLAFQTLLILAVPAQDAYTYVAGRQITLQTAPVDPYDLLRGHYQTLGYEISQVDRLRSLPGGDWFNQIKAGSFYLVLAAPDQTTPPQPWKPIRVSTTRPDLAANQVAIRGTTTDYGRITYGIETYYMPEAERNQMNQTIAAQTDRRAFVVDVKVDETGNAVPVSLWVNRQNYRF